MRWGWVAWLVTLAGCGAPAPPPTSVSEAVRPSPGAVTPKENSAPRSNERRAQNDASAMGEEQMAAVARAEMMGRLLREKDAISALGTDFVMDKFGPVPPGPPSQGWVTRRDGDKWTVTFMHEKGGAIEALYRVKLSPETKSALTERVDPPAAVDDTDAAMFRARQTALRAPFRACSDRYNSVVLPGRHLNHEGWLVYLIAATVDPDVVVAGGHHLMKVTQSGREITEQFAFTRSCINLRKRAPEGAEVVGLTISHLVSETPTELHVMMSLEHGLDLYVAVVQPRQTWKVSHGKLSRVGPSSGHKREEPRF